MNTRKIKAKERKWVRWEQAAKIRKMTLNEFVIIACDHAADIFIDDAIAKGAWYVKKRLQ